MFGSIDNLKIFGAIVGLVAIDMVDNLIFSKWPAQHLLGHKSMLSLAVERMCPMNQVAMPVQCPAFVTRMLRALARMRLGLYSVLMNPFPYSRLMNAIMPTHPLHRLVQGKVVILQFFFRGFLRSQNIRVTPNIGRIPARILVPFSWGHLPTTTSTKPWFGGPPPGSHVLPPGIGIREQHIGL